MHLYLIRHAQSINNALWLETGSSKWRNPDPGLSEIGIQQKEYLAKFLKDSDKELDALGRDPHNLNGFPITHIYCSLMVRAVETGLAIASAMNLPLYGWRDIHETGGIVAGDGETEPYVGLPGSSRSFFQENYPKLTLLDEFGEEGWWNRQFEEHEERLLRTRRVLKTFQEKHGRTDDRVIIVTHGAFYNYLMRALIGVEDRNLWFALSNTGITRWEFRQDGQGLAQAERSIDYSNRVDFLPKSLVTP